jgi:hypothetical protein
MATKTRNSSQGILADDRVEQREEIIALLTKASGWSSRPSSTT